MKKSIFKTISLSLLAVLICGCEIDNYKQPDASLFGKVTDKETGDAILQDIGGEGSQLEYIEQGFATTSSRYLNFKTDGSFCERNMFKGQYEIKANRTNFHVLPSTLVDVNGDTEFNIVTLPYCRVKVKELSFQEDKQRVLARFSVERTTGDNLKKVGLFCDQNKNVSFSINNDGDRSCIIDVNRAVTSEEEFTIKMPLTALDSASYWFRLGALTSVSEAKWNYAEAVQLSIIKKEVPQKEIGIRWDLFDHFEYWVPHKTVGTFVWDDKDFKSGTGSISSTSMAHDSEPGYTQFITPGEEGSKIPSFDISGIPFEGAHMLLTLNVSDPTHFEKSANGQIEIGSAGIFDQEEICWTFAQFDLRAGWQTLDLSLPEGNQMGSIRTKKLNWFRLYHLKEIASTTVKFDEIRFYYKTLVDGCEDESDWSSSTGVRLDESDYKQGEASVSTVCGNNLVSLSKKYKKPYYAPGTKKDGYLRFWLYVSDASKFNAGSGGQIEITSGGVYDNEELAWEIPAVANGWNQITLKLSEGIARGGDIDLKRVNFFRIWKNVSAAQGDVTVKVDGIRFYKEGFAPASEEDE